ncbi:MAG: oligosaccharide flippase family protein [Candidatus Rokubacteria bacterium]|nr:oligosaccharide flippase family protein [Candidatus Rokubacteria bacterium]
MRNLAGLGSFTAISQACAFGVLLLLTNGLGPEGFGTYVFGTSVLAYLVVVGGVGLGNVVVRDLNLLPEDADRTTTAFVVITVAGAAIAGAAAAVVAALAPVSTAERHVLLIVAIAAVPMCLNLNPLYDSHHRQALSAALSIPGDVLMLGGVAGLHYAGLLTAPGAALLLLGKHAITMIAQAAIYHRKVRPFRWAWDPRWARSLLRSGRFMLTAGLVYMVPLQGGVILARLLRGERDAGLYGVAFQIASAYLIAGTLVTRIVQPHIAGPYGLDRLFVRKLILSMGGTLIMLWLAGGGVAWLLIDRLLDPAYAPAFGPMLVLLTTATVAIATWAVNLYLLRLHRERTLQAVYVGAAAVYVALALLSAGSPLALFAAASLAVFTMVAAVVVPAARRAAHMPGGC